MIGFQSFIQHSFLIFRELCGLGLASNGIPNIFDELNPFWNREVEGICRRQFFQEPSLLA